jgi:hypothetical protein
MQANILCLLVLFMTGCTVNLPFNHRMSYSSIGEIKNISHSKQEPISIQWIPSSFPERVDIQGASGFVGGASQTRIPTGIGLSNRIIEALDVAIGVNNKSPRQLTISVINAENKFEYSAGFFNVTPAIDVGQCILEAEFAFADKHWKETFRASTKDPTIGGTSQTGVLEKVWDNIAVQVARNVLSHLEENTLPRSQDSLPPTSAPLASTQPSVSQQE